MEQTLAIGPCFDMGTDHLMMYPERSMHVHIGRGQQGHGAAHPPSKSSWIALLLH